MTINSLPPYEWVFQHLQVAGWPTLIVLAWKVSKYFERITATAMRTVDQVDKMATNCFPTMQASLANQDTLLHSMNESLKDIAANTRYFDGNR